MNSMSGSSNRDEQVAANPSAEAYFERQMDECGQACDEFARAALLLVKHGATREALHEQLDEVIERDW